MRLISASRRTDIPAFYAGWFMERVRRGTASWVNPYSGTVATVSLEPSETAAIVFWTRNFAPLLKHLPELEDRGHRFLVHFTLTGLPRRYETHVPPVRAAARQMHALAGRIGPDRILWRYDPILVTEETGRKFHLENFARLARSLEGATRRCTVSFAQIYGKLRRSFTRYGLPLPAMEAGERRSLAGELAGIAAERGIAMKACCNDDLLQARVTKARCIDAEEIASLWPELRFAAAAGPTREQCGCSRSCDIGAYDSCLHGCVYCYATKDRETAGSRRRRHDPRGSVLIPPPAPENSEEA
jgi:DNA repair photolyase